MPSEKQVRNEFKAICPELEQWGEAVDEILNNYLHSTFTTPEHIQREAKYRVKEIDSYCEKVLRKPSENPLLKITDKVGTRIVMLTTDDVEKVSDFIRGSKKWEFVEQSRDYQYEIYKEPEIFSYQSDHFIVKPLNTFVSKSDKNLLTCEIQVRTLLQHAYAEISHDTIYKNSSFDNPKAKRLLASAMALLETADEKFIQVYTEINNMSSFYYDIRKKLIKLYQEFVPEYDENRYNSKLAMTLLNVYSKQEQRQISDSIEDFVHSDYANISLQVSAYKNKSILFKQPIVLVAMFGIMELQTITYSKWPLSYDSISDVASSMNISMASLK
jgi:ppGpp synthetase/RelA/SpoT-type nucleotidyltranferase